MKISTLNVVWVHVLSKNWDNTNINFVIQVCHIIYIIVLFFTRFYLSKCSMYCKQNWPVKRIHIECYRCHWKGHSKWSRYQAQLHSWKPCWTMRFLVQVQSKILLNDSIQNLVEGWRVESSLSNWHSELSQSKLCCLITSGGVRSHYLVAKRRLTAKRLLWQWSRKSHKGDYGGERVKHWETPEYVFTSSNIYVVTVWYSKYM